MFTAQRPLDLSRGRQFLAPTISREARRAHFQASAWISCAEGSVRRANLRFVVAGAYDRATIMRAAVAQAAARRRVNGAAWAVCLADALRGVWKVARAQRGTVRPALAH